MKSTEVIMPQKSILAESFLESSSITNFYNGKSVFVTGATGFLGTVLVEKLLYSCKGINKIYVLIKRNEKPINEKFSEYVNKAAFQRIKEKDPGLMNKIIPIYGNLEEQDLGMSENDIKTLHEEVSVVFHLAAKLLFNMSLATAVNINTRPTEQLIAICKHMRNISVFVYVSSAYSNINRKVIDEKVYKSGISLETIYCTLEANNTNKILDNLLDGRPNTYTFSKALTEELIEKEFNEIPTAIVRPSIVGSSVKEPTPGWVHGWNGLNRTIAAGCMGHLLIWNGCDSVIFDVVPADYVANLLVAVAWETCENRTKYKHRPKVFNYCSGLRNPIEVNHLMNSCVQHRKYFGSEYTSKRRLKLISNFVVFKIYLFFYHIIPAFVLDVVRLLTGKKPVMLKKFKKLLRFSSYLEYFTQNQFLFLDSNVRALLKKMEDTDRQVFDFDITNLKWENYLEDFVVGIAKYNELCNKIWEKNKRNTGMSGPSTSLA